MAGNPLFVEMHERTQFHYWHLALVTRQDGPTVFRIIARHQNAQRIAQPWPPFRRHRAPSLRARPCV